MQNRIQRFLWHEAAITCNDKRIDVSWVRFPIEFPEERRLRILIYARGSRANQNPRSTDAQVDFCKAFLRKLGVTDVDFTLIIDDGIPWELRLSSGSAEAFAAIISREWDLIIVEDLTRLSREVAVGIDFLAKAVDQGVRVICINDRIDVGGDG